MSETNTREIRTYVAYILALVGSVTLVGTLGFHYFESGTNQNIHGLFDSFWWSMVTITTIGYGDIYPVTTGGRLFALFLMFTGIGILSVSTAGIAAYLVRFDQIEQLRTWGLKRHIVICGLGTMGFLLASAFRREGHEVLVVERDESNVLIQACRDTGAVVIAGNAADPDTLRRARLQHAQHLIVVCGQDGANAEVAARAHEAAEQRATKLGCSVQVVDPDLWNLLRGWGLATSKGLRLSFFNVFDLGARTLLEEVPPFDAPEGGEPKEAVPARDGVPHLLVVGGGRFAQHLILHAVRQWREKPEAAKNRLRLTVVAEDADAVRETLCRRHAGLERVVDFVPRSLSLTSPAFHQGGFLWNDDRTLGVSRIYVCPDDEALTVSTALVLLRQLRGAKVPFAVRLNQEAGLASLLGTLKSRPGFGHVHVFGLLEHACQPDLITRGENEILARALHEEYVRSQRVQGADLTRNPAAVPWSELTHDLRELNRTEADHIAAKLESVRCRLVPLVDLEADLLEFDDHEVEQLAIMEHERWLAERRALGWTLGPRDAQKRTNPNLKPWADLDEEPKVMSRGLVRQLPALLARTGLAVHRDVR